MMTTAFNILCVEDDADSREMLAVLLGIDYPACSITSVKSAAEALRLIADTPFDLYILDNWLEEVSGLDISRKIRESDASVPVVMYSAVAGAADRQAALDAGVDVFLVKPNDFDQVAPTVERLLASNRPIPMGTCA